MVVGAVRLRAGARSCNAAPSQGRRSHSPTTLHKFRYAASCNAAPSQGRRSLGVVGPDNHPGVTLQCGSVSGTEITQRSGEQPQTTPQLQCGSVSGTEITPCHTIGILIVGPDAAMRLRLRDGDHATSVMSALDAFAAFAAMRLRLRDGDHSTRPSTLSRWHAGCNAAPSQGRRSPRRAAGLRQEHAATGCNAAPSQGRRSPTDAEKQQQLAAAQLQCGSVSGTEITVKPLSRNHITSAGCNAAPSQGRRSPRHRGGHLGGRQRSLQCGSVSGTEITVARLSRSRAATSRCNAAPSQGRRSHGRYPWGAADRTYAAMRLRLRDGDHHA
mgnify:CR=1 FL=1